MIDTQMCNVCKKAKDMSCFKFNDKKHTYNKTCKECSERNRIYALEHKEEISEYSKQYRLKNKDKIKNDKKQYALEHKEEMLEYQTQYRSTRKEQIKEYNKQYRISNKKEINAQYKARRDTDVIFKLRTNMSNAINMALKSANGSKQGKSVMDFLSYDIEELKAHLESQFEPWMTWNNQGKYVAETWKDNDQSTWTWNIDHIIPQADLPFASMGDENFRKCWALSNLRPYSSKQNQLDGATRVRHSKSPL